MRYILYARKSSESAERQVQSLPDQDRALSELADRHGLTLIDKLAEAKSAKEPGIRPVYGAMLGRIKRGEADGILCWSINRLCRNPVDAGELAWLLQRGVIQSIRTIDREYRPEDSALLMSFETGVATQYVIDLSKNVKRGLHQKADRGWWPTKPPAGYMVHAETRKIVPDPRRFPLIRRAWDLLLSGNATVPTILEQLEYWGYSNRGKGGRPGGPMGRSSLYRLFANPFYYGCFYYGGAMRSGRHRRMVSQAEFERAQQIIGGGSTTRAQRYEFAFTGLIRCGVCGCQITAERRVKNYPTTSNHREYVYYHCTGARGCPIRSVSESYLDGEIQSLAQRCRTNGKLQSWLETVLARDLREGPTTTQAIEQQQRTRIGDLRRRLNTLYEMRTGQEITAEEFVLHKNELQTELTRLEQAERTRADRWSRNLKKLKAASRFSQTAYERFTGGDPAAKKQIAGLLADSYSLTLGELRIEPNPIFDVLRTFEPPNGGSDSVQAGSNGPVSPIQRAEWDHVRTLLSEVDLRFDYETPFAASDEDKDSEVAA